MTKPKERQIGTLARVEMAKIMLRMAMRDLNDNKSVYEVLEQLKARAELAIETYFTDGMDVED